MYMLRVDMASGAILQESVPACLSFSVGVRLSPVCFWTELSQVRAHVPGISKEGQQRMCMPRPDLVVEFYVEGEDLRSASRNFCCCSALPGAALWELFCLLPGLSERDPEEVARMLGQPVGLVKSFRELWDEARQDSRFSERDKREELGVLAVPSEGGFPHALRQVLLERHPCTPGAAGHFEQELHRVAHCLSSGGRSPDQTVWTGVGQDRAPARRLTDWWRVSAVLDYLGPEGWPLVHRDRFEELKWACHNRFATGAYYQGAFLIQPDLFFVLGISVDAARFATGQHLNVILRTRCRLADMHPMLSRAEEVVEPYTDGYAETEVVRCTGCEYESVKRHVLNFAQRSLLARAGRACHCHLHRASLIHARGRKVHGAVQQGVPGVGVLHGRDPPCSPSLTYLPVLKGEHNKRVSETGDQ